MEFEETEVFQDILNNDLCHLQVSLKTAECNVRDHDGRSYLHVALDQGADEAVFEQLLSYVDISWRDESSSNILDLAESKSNKNLEKMILKQMLEVLRTGTFQQIEKLLTSGWTVWPLPTAICSISGIRPEVSPMLFYIQAILEKVNDVHVSIMKGRKDTTICESHLAASSADVTGLPPLQKAAIFNHKYYVRYLIDNFPHVINLQDYMGRTALHYAVVMEDGDITNMLIDAGALDSIKDVHNHTAMTYQELPHLNTISDVQRHIRFTLHKPQQLKFFDPETLDIVEPSQTYGDPDKNLGNHGDNHRIKHLKTVVTLLRLQQLNSISNRQLEVFEDTILYETVLINDVEEVRFLLEHDYNTQCRSLEGQSYLHLAVTQNVSAEIVHLLLQVIDISLCDSDGYTALDLAVTDDVSTDILYCLLDYVVKLLVSEDFMRLDELVAKGWRHWPPDRYWDCFTQKIRSFLGSLKTIEEQVDKVHSKISRGEKLLPEEVVDVVIENWDRTGLPALHKAVICGNREAVEDILRQQPELVNNTDTLSRSALHYAACLSDQSLFNMLLSNHAVTTLADTWGFTPKDYKLHPNLINIPNLIHHINTIIGRSKIVVAEEHWASILQMYNYDKCAVPEDTMEESDLYKAIKENQTDRVIKLLEEDKNDLRLRNENGDTFLHVVVKQSGSLDIFKALVRKLSDTSLLLRNEASQTAYDLIISGDYPREAADVLRDAVWRWVSEGGWTRAEQVLSSGWDIWSLNTQQTQGTGDLQEKIGKFQSEVEAFHKSVMEGNVEEVKKVLEADNESLLTAADKTGTYPLQKAIIFQQNTILNLLLESKYKSKILNLSDNMKRAAAHYAGGSHDGGHVYSILKEGGADLTIKDLRDKTPEDYYNRPEDLSVVEVQRRLRDLLYPDNDASQSDQQQTQQQEDNTQQQLNNTETTETDSTTQSVEQKENLINSKPPTPSTPPGRKPVQMYISSDIYEKKNVPPPVTVDGRYIARHLGSALTSALAEIAESRPWDPIEYLAHWLLKYRQNLDYNKSQEDMLKNIRSEEAAMDEEEMQRAKRLEEERQIREEEERKRQEEEEEERQRKEEEELQRKAKELALLQKPLLQTVSEELEEDNLYKERDERGQTELHKLAAQEGADLVALFNLGYSLADRDINNQTPRDIAEDNDIQENLDAMDSYITNMIEQEKLDALQQLLLDGYDKLDAVLAQVSTDGLPEEVTDFLKAVPEFQVKIQEALKAVESGVLREVEQCLDRKKFALAKDKYGRSPLHIAVLIENREIVEYIVKHFPVTVKCRDNLNRTPLHYASALSEKIADILKSVPGVDEQAKDVKDRTPVYYSTEKTEIQQMQNQFRMSKAETDNSDQTETETDQNDQQKTEPEQVTSATD